MKSIQTLKTIDPRTIRLLFAAITMILFVLSAAAPGSPGDVGIR
jgi:hypothetical protein